MNHSQFLSLFLIVLSPFAQAEIGNVESLMGNYELRQEIDGECLQTLSIIKKDFLNQRAEFSIAIYGTAQRTGERKIVAQLTNLNRGVDFYETREPMFGFKDGSVYSLEQINSKKIQAVNRYKNVPGVILRENILNAEYNSSGIYIETSDLNTLRGDLVTHKTKCLYIKK